MPTYIAASASSACSMSLPERIAIGSLGRQPAPQQRRADAPGQRQHLRVAQRAPAAVGVALRRGTRGRARPWPSARAARSAWRDRARSGCGGADMDDAVGSRSQHGVERRRAAPGATGADASRVRDAAAPAHVGPRVTFGARFSRKSLQPRLGLAVGLRDRRHQRLHRVAARRIASRRCAAARA